LFGWDHCEAGRQLITSWSLPAEFEIVAAEHHVPSSQDGGWGINELIKMSCRMADAVGFTAFPGCESTPYPDLLEELPARERKRFHGDAASLAFEIANRIHAVESV
jgi:hypothetical protein